LTRELLPNFNINKGGKTDLSIVRSALVAFALTPRDKGENVHGGWMAWLHLLAAAMFEIGWIYSLKFTEGFTRFLPTLFYIFFGLGAVFFLSLALRYMPVGITYAVWVGIAAAGSNIVGILFFGEPYRFARILFIVMIIGGVLGLKFSSVK
jgi:quaternary ammonium compound-resistance protein SugE